MGWLRFFRRRYWDDERARELQAYLDEEIDDNLARGLPPDEARRAAHRRLGNPARIREEIYEMNTVGFVESVWQDVRFAVRVLRRNPTFAVVAILTLALGTGANAAVFQLVDAVRLRMLPVERPDELVEVQVDARDGGRTGRFTGRRPMLTNVLWERIRDGQEGLASVMAWSPVQFDLSGGGEEQPVGGLWVSGAFFETLGVPAAIGRMIGPSDDTAGCSAPGAVISHAFWTRRFGASPRVLDQTILLDGHRFDIIGVTPARFFGVEVGRSFDVALPLCSEPIFRSDRSALAARDHWFLAVFGRLKSGWSIDRARAQLRGIAPGIFKETLPPTYVPEDAAAYLAFLLDVKPVGTGVSGLRSAYSTPLGILLGVTGLVLLIACANLANLMLARATARGREIGVRLAIGASRRRIVRQMLSESLVLAALGAFAGLLVARWLSAFLVAFLSTDDNRLVLDLTVDWRIFAFTGAIGGAACLLFGLAPALRATAIGGATTTLGLRAATDGRERFTLRAALVVVQVALSLVLLVGALLFGASLRNLVALDPGFREQGVLAVNMDLRRAGIPEDARLPLFDTIVERLRAVPGIDGAAEAFITPMSGSGWNNRIVIDAELQPDIVNFNAVGPGYFQTLGTRLVAGRDFTAHDAAQSVPVAIVNELFVKKYLAGSSPLGRVFHVQESPGSTPNPRYQVVGVVADTKYRDLREEPMPIAYLAAAQESERGPFLWVVVHSTLGTAAIVPGVTHAIREVNPAITIQFRSMERMIADSLTGERLMAALSGFFGGLAVLIAIVGLYGVMSYVVARRRMEIGIRMALGADARAVVRMVVTDAARLVAIGLVVGTALAILGARSAGALLFGLEPWDPATLAIAATGLGSVALLASWLPAYRAARIPPTTALREE